VAEHAPARRWRPDRIEGFWWFAFANGGLVAAIFLPVHILVQGILGPLGVPVVDQHYDSFAAVLANPIVKLYLFVIISLPLFHWAHRMRFLLIDLGLTMGQRALKYVLYGLAIVGTLLTAYILITVP
jgi:fumarate reductase subunit D